MSGYSQKLSEGAYDIADREILDPSGVIQNRRYSSLSTTNTLTGFSTSPKSSSCTLQSTAGSDMLLPLGAIMVNSYIGISNNSAMLSLNPSQVPSSNTTQTSSWLDTVICETLHVTQADDDTDMPEVGAWPVEDHSSVAARPTKRELEIDNDDAESNEEAQRVKRPRLPALKPYDAQLADEDQLAVSSKPKRAVALLKSENTTTRTPLPSCRNLIELIPKGVEDTAQAHLEDSKFSQHFVAGRGWTAVNNGPQIFRRPEDDLTIEINTIVRAPHVDSSSIDRTHINAHSPPPNTCTLPLRRSCRGLKCASLHKRPAPKRKASPPTTASTRRVAPPRSSNNTVPTIAGPSGPPSPDNSSDPASNTSSEPPKPQIAPSDRPKWTGKPFKQLALEALRGATDTGHALSLAGITAHIEKYRLTTNMRQPALNQTIRAAVLRFCVHKRPQNGLWEREVVRGEYTGRYVLVGRGRDGDVSVSVGVGDGCGREDDGGGGKGAVKVKVTGRGKVKKNKRAREGVRASVRARGKGKGKGKDKEDESF